MKKISLMIIEDVADIRNNLVDYFCQQEEIAAVVAFESMEALFESLTHTPPTDVMLSDIGLPGMSGIEGIKRIKE